MKMDDHSLGFMLNDVARLMRYKFDARARAIGATRPQWRLLMALSRAPGATQAALADIMDVERITLCRMVDRLEEAGLVERRSDPSDRRVWRIFVTEKGEETRGRLLDIGQELLLETREVLNPGEEEHLIEMLSRIRDSLTRCRDNLSASA